MQNYRFRPAILDSRLLQNLHALLLFLELLLDVVVLPELVQVLAVDSLQNLLSFEVLVALLLKFDLPVLLLGDFYVLGVLLVVAVEVEVLLDVAAEIGGQIAVEVRGRANWDLDRPVDLGEFVLADCSEGQGVLLVLGFVQVEVVDQLAQVVRGADHAVELRLWEGLGV